MQHANLMRGSAILALAALAACHASQPSLAEGNAQIDAQLSTINAATSNTDGMDQGNAELMAVPTAGQTLDASPQPPKKQ